MDKVCLFILCVLRNAARFGKPEIVSFFITEVFFVNKPLCAAVMEYRWSYLQRMKIRIIIIIIITTIRRRRRRRTANIWWIEVEQFWSEIWGNNKSHNEAAEWIRKQDELHKQRESQPWRAIDADEVTRAIKKSSNWKSPGKDKVTNFWRKHHISIHGDMSKAYTKTKTTGLLLVSQQCTRSSFPLLRKEHTYVLNWKPAFTNRTERVSIKVVLSLLEDIGSLLLCCNQCVPSWLAD